MGDHTKSLQVTLYCVAVCRLSETIGPCLLMARLTEPCGFYAVLLTSETGDLVSPLYEHTLMLKPVATGDNKPDILEDFAGECCFEVVSRKSFRYRLDKQYTQASLNKELTKLLGWTFFVPIDYFHVKHGNNDAYLRPVFDVVPKKNVFTRYAYLDCDKSEDRKLLGEWLQRFHHIRVMHMKSKKRTFDLYWTEFMKINEEPLKLAVSQLTLYKKNEGLYQKGDLLLLFRGWKEYKHIQHYFLHEANGALELTYALERKLEAFPHTQTCLPPLQHFSVSARSQLLDFTQLLQSLASKEIEPRTLTRANLPLSLVTEVFAGHLYAFLRAVAIPPTRELKRHLLLPLLTQKVESQAKLHALYNKASLDAISVRTLYLAYQTLTTPNEPTKIPSDHAFGLEETEEEEGNSYFESCLSDFERLLQMLHTSVKRNALPEWYLNASALNKTITANSSLYFICGDQKLLEQEKSLWTLYDKRILGKVDCSVRYHASQPLESEQWQTDWLSLKESVAEVARQQQQYTFLLFTPLELKENQDLACLQSLLFADVFNTTILCEASDLFLDRRLSRHFAEQQKDLSVRQLHEKFCFTSRQFVTVDKRAVRETVLVPQCHNLSLEAMQNLLLWLSYHSQTIKRVVLMGSTAIIPTITAGQAFLDLLRVVSPRVINPPLYQYGERYDDLESLFEKRWQVLPALNLMQVHKFYQQEEQFKQRQCALLYYLRNAAALGTVLERHSKVQVQVYVLYKNDSWLSSKKKEAFLDLLKERFQSVKDRSRITLRSMEINMLGQHDATEPQQCEFVMDRESFLNLEPNQYLHLFTLLDSLYVVEDEDLEDPSNKLAPQLRKQIRKIQRPNLRYSYLCLAK